MTDRELLELAAKAAGYSYRWLQDGDRHLLRVCYEKEPKEGALFDSMDWNPLKDDGDALRLAFVVGLKVDTAKREVWYCKTPALGKWLSIGWVDGIEGLRQAIVRAAAEIGKTMGDSQVERGFNPVTPQQFSDLCKTHWDQSGGG